jgi:hypothetical protein
MIRRAGIIQIADKLQRLLAPHLQSDLLSLPITRSLAISTGIVSMLFMRTALVCGVAVALLPSDPAKQQALLAGAHQGLQWAMTYCDRQPAQCMQAQVTWDSFVTKAQFGLQLASEMADRYGSKAEPPKKAEPAPVPVKQPARRTKAPTTTIEPLRVRTLDAPAAPDKRWDSFQ